MDTSDPSIIFDANGVCSHCHYFDNVRKPTWFPNDEGKSRLDRKIAVLKKERAGHEYDCMIGLSGGVDSSYLAYFLKNEYDLRMLAVHVDGGWNSELAVSNIENIVRRLDLDLFTHVVDWQEMRKVQVAFLRSGVVNQDTPQDHAYFAALYRTAKKFDIKNFYVGYNIQNESILPRSWQGVSAMDTVQFNYILKKFCDNKINKFPKLSFFEQYIYYPYLYRMEKFSPLNFLVYNKSEAKAVITNELGWRDYGVKHGESRFTRYFQSYYLPQRFGFDKRRAHLSSLVLAGELSRQQALIEISEKVYKTPREIHEDVEYVAKKLGLEELELKNLMLDDTEGYKNYPNAENIMKWLRRFKKVVKNIG